VTVDNDEEMEGKSRAQRLEEMHRQQLQRPATAPQTQGSGRQGKELVARKEARLHHLTAELDVLRKSH